MKPNVLEKPIDLLPKTSSLTIKKLKALEIHTFFDLLNYFPSRYEDYSVVSSINRLQEGEIVTIKGSIAEAKQLYAKAHMKIQKFLVQDATGTIEVSWYNQSYLLTLFRRGTLVSIAGIVRKFGKKLVLEPKEFEALTHDQEPIHTGRIIPIYSEKRGLSSKTIRDKIYSISNKDYIEEYLPLQIIKYNELVKASIAYRAIHFPESRFILTSAKERLAFDELFFIQLSAGLVRQSWEKESVTHSFQIEKYRSHINQFISQLPFALTSAQKKVLQEILIDFEQVKPMNRFLQGDVGSGKTVIAAIACYIAYLNGFQSIIMAPTEILASQHFQTISNLFAKANTPPLISFVTGSSKPEKDELEQTNVIIGTHALIQKKISYKKIGFVVIDEQHRFGVSQRAMLKKKGVNPHLLTMTATPIPRTAALTLYGELDLSVIDEMPVGRIPIKTFFVPSEKRQACYKWINEKIATKNAQIFIVCPLIEESEIETMKSVRAAKKEFEYLKKHIFPTKKVALLHGKLKAQEKQAVMSEFRNKSIDILVATSVVEVGVDIPNAQIMMIEGAERYGLAQLHQLRGRVGRGDQESFCLLFSDTTSQEVKNRLSFFSRNNNGMILAEYDLQKRGAGEIYGSRQHGTTELKIASLGDLPLIEKTKLASDYFLKNYGLSDFPILARLLHTYNAGLISRD